MSECYVSYDGIALEELHIKTLYKGIVARRDWFPHQNARTTHTDAQLCGPHIKTQSTQGVEGSYILIKANTYFLKNKKEIVDILVLPLQPLVDHKVHVECL